MKGIKICSIIVTIIAITSLNKIYASNNIIVQNIENNTTTSSTTSNNIENNNVGNNTNNILVNKPTLNNTENSVENNLLENNSINNFIDNKNTKSLEVNNSTNIVEDSISDEDIKKEINLKYCTHIQDIGWQDWKQNGGISGTTGQSKRLEAIKIKIDNLPENAKILYQVHIQDIGWQDWKNNGNLAGTTGQGKRLEAIRIKLNNIPGYTIEYRTHVEDIGWQEWKKEGLLSGTTGKSKRLEAIEVRIVKGDSSPYLSYNTHVENIGWMDSVSDGEISGTTGKALRIEAIKIEASNLSERVQLKSMAYVQGIGWQNWKNSGEIIGTTGKAKRLEAIRIKLEGTNKYSIAYRTHVEDIGWQDWVYDGEIAGTTGISKRVEAIQIKIVDKITEQRKIAFKSGTYGKSGLKIKGNKNGTDLKYYKIGSGPSVFFATFAIHGWEDDFDYDGQELTKIAEQFKNRLISMNDIDLANKWTIYIFPSLNPDGEYFGWTHNGPGRTTLYSDAPEHKGIDMNRAWSTNWVKYTTNRNFTGTEPFQAYEARYLRDFLLSHKSKIGQTVLVDLHGWLNETMGDDEIGAYYRSKLGMSKHISAYGRGYLINWARSNLGSSGRTARSALIELPEAYSSSDVTNWKLSDKYINATINMLREI